MMIDTRRTAHIGTIVAVCTNGNGRPKRPRDSISVKDLCRKRDNGVRRVCVLAQETLDSINERGRSSLQPGDLAESITTVGLGDLSDVPAGACIKVYGRTLFEVIGYREIPERVRGLGLNLERRCGLICSVIGDLRLTIRPQDVIEIVW